MQTHLHRPWFFAQHETLVKLRLPEQLFEIYSRPRLNCINPFPILVVYGQFNQAFCSDSAPQNPSLIRNTLRRPYITDPHCASVQVNAFRRSTQPGGATRTKRLRLCRFVVLLFTADHQNFDCKVRRYHKSQVILPGSSVDQNTRRLRILLGSDRFVQSRQTCMCTGQKQSKAQTLTARVQ